ncbi:MAG: HNH endonuclease family protein [Acutalibacteraceae bacterium]
MINYENVTIEHISSQADALPLPEFSGENAHRFYNLTILTVAENDRVKNKPYTLKKPIYEVSAYVLNKQFSTIAAWNYTEAKRWEEYLKDFACKFFVV